MKYVLVCVTRCEVFDEVIWCVFFLAGKYKDDYALIGLKSETAFLR